MRARARVLTSYPSICGPTNTHTCDPVRSDGDGTLTFLDYLKCVDSPHERARESKERERERERERGARPLALVISHFVCASPSSRSASAKPFLRPPTDTPSVPAATSARLGQGHVQARTQKGGEGRAREEVA